MDTNKFITEYRRMCRKYARCSDCPLNTDGLCRKTPGSYTKEFASILKVVEDWAAANPVTTRAYLFKKIYPSAATGLSGALFICPAMVDIHFRCEDETECVKCRKKYWLEEVQDGRC